MEAQLVETTILNLINHQSLIATKTSRVVYAADGDGIMEFGLRRAQGPDAGLYGARAAIIGGCVGTSNVLAGQYGIRLDSGDLAYLSKKARKMLDEAGFPDASICASNDLDEYLLHDLKAQGAAINSWGVGTHLITSKDCPSFGGVYKLSAIKNENGEFIPKIKISENTEKITNPGNKTIYRVYEKETGKIKADLICFADETFDESQDLLLFDPLETWKKTKLAGGTYTMREMLVPIFKNGECIYTSPSVTEIAEYCKQEKDSLWDETKRLFYPHRVYVDLSQRLYDVKKALLDQAHKPE